MTTQDSTVKTQIILYKTGTISVADKAALRVAGYLPIACANPDDVALLFPDGARLKGDLIFQAALQAMAGPNSTQERERFGTSILRQLITQPKA